MSDIELSLEMQAKLISTEAISLQKLGKYANAVKLPKFVKGFMAQVKDTIDDIKLDRMGMIRPTSIPKILGKTKYVSIMDVDIYKPSGMVGNYNQTLAVLEKWDRELMDLQERLLNPLNRWLGELLTDQSSMVKNISDSRFPFADVKGLREDLKKVFDESDVGDREAYGELIANNTEWEVVVERANALYTRFLEVDLPKLREQVEEIVKRVSTLSKRIKEDPENYKISGSNLKMIVDAVFETGVEVEAFGIYGFKLQTIMASLASNEKRIKEIVS